MTDTRLAGIGTKVLRKSAIPELRFAGMGVKVLRGSRSLLNAQIKVWDPTTSTWVPASLSVWDSATSTWITKPGYAYYGGTWLQFQ